MSRNLQKKLLLSLIKESKKMFIKESSPPVMPEEEENNDTFSELTPEQQKIVDVATQGGYRGNLSPEAKEILSQLRLQYKEVGYTGLSPEFKAIIDVQEIQKEEYRAMLSRGYEEYIDNTDYAEIDKKREESTKAYNDKIDQDKKDKALDNLYQTQDDLSGIRTSHYVESIDRKLDEMFYTQREQGDPQTILAQDTEGNQWHANQDKIDLAAKMNDHEKNLDLSDEAKEDKLSPEDKAQEDEDNYYQDLIDSLKDSESDHQEHLENKTNSLFRKY